jgi:hypothetical protein
MPFKPFYPKTLTNANKLNLDKTPFMLELFSQNLGFILRERKIRTRSIWERYGTSNVRRWGVLVETLIPMNWLINGLRCTT